jgi:hypothetical protein
LPHPQLNFPRGQDDSLHPTYLAQDRSPSFNHPDTFETSIRDSYAEAAVRTIPQCPNDPRAALSAERYADLARLSHDADIETVVQRKVRCDETKPECNTCRRRGTKCPGYRPAQSFILHQFDKETERPQLIKEDEERYRYAYQTVQTTNSVNSSRIGSTVTLVVQQEQATAEVHVPKQVSAIAVDRIQHLGTFIRLYLPRADGPALPPPSALMLALPTMPANSQVLLAAIDALSAAQLAVNDRDHALVNRSRSMYGAALSQMMKAIQDPVLALKDETLLSTYLLTLYEVRVLYPSTTNEY